jgi:hypothetical protein
MSGARNKTKEISEQAHNKQNIKIISNIKH